ncbi:hypothetical protein NBRC10512_001452 [Rhodotorula toruloides]
MSDSETQTYVLQTAGFDARFPNTNQSRHCFQAYVDYFRCVNAKGEDFPACKTFWRTYHSLCPNVRCAAELMIPGFLFSPISGVNRRIAKWDEQREENKFPAKLD